MIKKTTITRYENEDGFEFTFEPAEDSLTIIKTKEGFEARYLVHDDELTRGPDENGDNGLFLVHYHKDFEIRRDKIITQNDAKNWYRRTFEDYAYEDESGKEVIPSNIPQAVDYFIYPVTAYIHSGVALYLGNTTHPFDSQGWDTSHVGLVLASKKEFKDEDEAEKAAKGLIKTWNCYLSGDIWGCVRETYDKKKEQVDQESCWGYYGYEYALEELKSF